MKSGGPWNLRGLRPEARETADDAARRAGISVGEWLNELIQQSGNSSGALMRQPGSKEEDYGNVAWPDQPTQPGGAAANGSSQRPHNREYEREQALAREASLAREEFDDVHSRLDKLTSQLERIARGDAPSRIARNPVPPSSSGPTGAEAPIDLTSLEQQLRHLTNRIESLQPVHDFEKLIAAFRADLLEISSQITQALPRQAVDTLGLQVEALAERIDHSRQSGVDSSVIAAIERGLADVRDALQRLTTAESLVGFDESIKALAQKVDLIIARQDPAALEQLETAIGALRGIVSHVASSDTLNRVAEDVRVLAVKVDALANNAASGRAISALECRIDALAGAMHASAVAGHAAPRELERLLSALIEKLERSRLSQTDHAAFHRLEERIALLIKRLDASDAQLGNLKSIERGLADLLVHLDRADAEPAVVDAIARDVAEIRRGEQRTQDSLEAVHGSVEQVVNRLAMIEGDIRSAAKPPEARCDAPIAPTNEKISEPAPEPDAVVSTAPWSALIGASPSSVATDVAAGHADTRRPPIDPTLPPDHPLEPGSAAGLRSASVVERIADGKPAPGGRASDRQDFIAAARRAVQAAATPAGREIRFDSRRRRSSRKTGTSRSRPSHARKLLVGTCVVLLTIGCLQIALHMLQGERVAIEAPAVTDQPLPPPAQPETSSRAVAPSTGQASMPTPAAPSDSVDPSSNKSHDSGSAAQVAPNRDAALSPPPALPQAPSLAPASITVTPLSAPIATATTSASGPAPTATAAPTPAPASAPAAQPSAPRPAEVTGTLPSRMPPPALSLPISAPASQPLAQSESSQASISDSAIENLPVTIGGPALRAAAIAGDTAAEFEVALRFAQGRGVPPDQRQAAHWFALAAQQGLAPAQFRLGGFYEKGIGVKKDLAEARTLYLSAAAKGNGKAMHNLAVLYAEGINGPGDYHTAALWFHKAAERGITDSQYNLGILYERGSGEPQNYTEAYKWFALAADQGDSEAAAKRDEIAAKLDQQTLEAAELAVKAWAPERQPDDATNVKAPPGGWDAVERVARAKVPLPLAKPTVPESKIK
jgi:localization factor PodJL